jgi:glutathione S-transferase
MGSSSNPEIILYTNHGCPWAHRAQIILHELGVPFKEEIIDLAVPRTAEYLKVNPRGLVPSISYNGEIITESLIVSQFLADAIPSHILKKSDEAGGALQRARINFFVDTYFSKINSLYFSVLRAKQGAEKNAAATKYVDAVAKEIEPLLKDAEPYFGGAKKFTLAEVSLHSPS